MAPTDDCFTLIAPGTADRDQDGPAVTGDPDLGFAPLQQFGPTLQHHTLLKVRANIRANFIMGKMVRRQSAFFFSMRESHSMRGVVERTSVKSYVHTHVSVSACGCCMYSVMLREHWRRGYRTSVCMMRLLLHRMYVDYR